MSNDILPNRDLYFMCRVQASGMLLAGKEPIGFARTITQTQKGVPEKGTSRDLQLNTAYRPDFWLFIL